MEQIGTTRDGRPVKAHAYRTGCGLVFGVRADMFPHARELGELRYELFSELGCLDAPPASPAGAARGTVEWMDYRGVEQAIALRGGYV